MSTRFIRRRIIAALIVSNFVAAGVLYVQNAARSTAQKHLDRLEYLRTGPFLEAKNAREWVSIKGARYAGWFVRQKIAGKSASYQEWADALEAEQQALLALGIFERKWLLLPRRDAIDHPRLRAARVSQTRFTIHTDATRAWEIRVTAAHVDMEEFRAAIDLIAR